MLHLMHRKYDSTHPTSLYPKTPVQTRNNRQHYQEVAPNKSQNRDLFKIPKTSLPRIEFGCTS